MTLAELKAYDVAAAWAALSPNQQTAIGEAAIASTAAGLIADDGCKSPEARRIATAMTEEAADVLEEAIADACPSLNWLLGTFEPTPAAN
jgi:hypothetical protein